MQPVAPAGHIVDRKGAVVSGLRVVAVLHDQHVGDHARVHVAVDAYQPGGGEHVALCFAAVVTLAGASRYRTASLKSGEGLLSFSRMTIRPATRPGGPGLTVPAASSATIAVAKRIANLSKLLRPRAWSLL